MIILTRMLNKPAHVSWNPVAHPAPRETKALWFFAPHMYGNPYQDLLYSGFSKVGIQARGFRTIEAAVQAIERAPRNLPRVLHLHWLNVVLADAKTESDTQRLIAEFEAQLDRVLAVGARLVWSVHNVLPHESYDSAAAVRVRNAIISRAELVHVMSPDTVALCRPYFTIPESKVLRAEHAGYHGHYPTINSTDLRREWAIAQGGRVGVVIGGIKPYKGLNEFAEHFVNATRMHQRDVTLIIAGKAGDEVMHSQLWKLAELSSNLHVIPRMLTDEQVASLTTMADFTVIPYRNSLNSGALVLGLTFGTPVLARASAGSTHLLEDGAGRIYHDDAELESELRNLAWIDDAKPHAQRMSRRLDRTTVTDNFAAAAMAFIHGGAEAAQQQIGPHGGLND